jgi:hypothetical protein
LLIKESDKHIGGNIMANSKQRAENGQGSIRWINERECECMIQSQYLNPKTGKPKRFKRKQYFPVPLF